MPPISFSSESLNTGQTLLTYPDIFTAIAALASERQSELTAMAVNIAPFGLHEPTSFGSVCVVSVLQSRASMSHRQIRHHIPFETVTIHLPSCPVGSGTKRISEMAEFRFACQSTLAFGAYLGSQHKRRLRSRASRVATSSSRADIRLMRSVSGNGIPRAVTWAVHRDNHSVFRHDTANACLHVLGGVS